MLTMDIGKRNRLVARLSQEPEPQIVPIEVFFDGNDDLGSIGCNLLDHPALTERHSESVLVAWWD
jgi:hypothetical protein